MLCFVENLIFCSLAQTKADSKYQLLWAGLCILAVLVMLFAAYFVYMKMKKTLLDDNQKTDGQSGFDLENLSQMLKNGQINQEEYKTLRDKIIY